MRHLRWPVLGSLGLTAAIGSELFDCTDDDEWMDFRRLVEANAAAGYPTDVDLVVKAQGLVQLQGTTIEVDQEAAYGAAKGMRDFQRSCNAPPSAPTPSPFCLYGVVTALWVVARHSHPDRRNLLQHASFLLGSTLNHVLDFTESSAWPITLADVLANIDAADRDQDFLLPGDVASRYGMPLRPSPEEALAAVHVAESFDHETIRIEVWEVGVHASLSAEPIHMFAQILSGTQMKYRNLIKDQYPVWMPNRCETLYWHPKLECYEPDDEISQLFQRRIPHSATSKDPVTDIDGLAEEFEIAASARLNYVDFMLCTVAYLCLMLKDLDLPVLGYFGHPLLFMVPDDQDVREKYWERFAAMASKSSVEFAVSDPFLQMQFEYQLGKPTLPIIRTHALYTGTTHFPTRAAEVLVLDRPHEAILMCAIQRLMGGTPIDWPLADGRLTEASSSEYPFRFVTRAMTDRKFGTFAQFRAVVLWPYDMDLITFYEFYGMNMPIFMPSQLSKYLFHQDHQSYNYRWGERDDPGDYSIWATEEWSPFQELSPGAAHRIVGFSDYFRFPAVQYFDSMPHLLLQLPTLDFFEVVQAMARFNRDSMAESARAWRLLLRRATGFEAEFF